MRLRGAGVVAGAVTAVYPGALALLGALALVGRRSVRLPYPALLLAASVLWLLPAASDLFLGRVGPVTLGEVGQLAVFLLVAAGGAALGRALGSARHLVPGLLVGLGAVALASAAAAFEGPAGRVALWTDHPNILGASVLLPAAATALLARSVRIGAAAIAAAAVPVGLSGSRSALIVLIVTAAYLVVAAAARRWRGGRARLTLAVASLAVAALAVVGAVMVQPRLGAFVSDLARLPLAALKPGLLGVPQPLGVTVTDLEGGELRLERTGSDWWSRLQYPLVLLPGKTYTFSVELAASGPADTIGVYGAVNADDTVTAARRGAWEATATGALVVTHLSTEELADGWTRVTLTFESGSHAKSWIWIGPAPDLAGAGGSGAAVRVRATSAWEGGENAKPAGAQTAEAASLATNQAVARVYAFVGAWSGFEAAPVFGQRGVEFASYFRHQAPTFYTAVPTHAHNAFLQSLFESGTSGTLGFLLLLVWAGAAIASRSDHRGLLVLLAVAVLANTVDTVMWSAGMMYFLAAVGGMVAGFGAPPADLMTE